MITIIPKVNSYFYKPLKESVNNDAKIRSNSSSDFKSQFNLLFSGSVSYLPINIKNTKSKTKNNNKSSVEPVQFRSYEEFGNIKTGQYVEGNNDNFIGNIKAKGFVDLGNYNVIGNIYSGSYVNLMDSNSCGNIKAKDYVNIKNFNITGHIEAKSFISCQAACKIKGNIIMPSNNKQKIQQIVNLGYKTEVFGDIYFETGNGIVYKDRDAVIHGKIIGGKISTDCKEIIQTINSLKKPNFFLPESN